jgi:hypothetical protein
VRLSGASRYVRREGRRRLKKKFGAGKHLKKKRRRLRDVKLLRRLFAFLLQAFPASAWRKFTTVTFGTIRKP